MCRSRGTPLSEWNFPKIPLKDLVNKLKNKLPDIKIGEHLVVFEESGIKVGCQKITNDQIKEIYNQVFGEAKC